MNIRSTAIIAMALLAGILIGCNKGNENNASGAGVLLLGLASTGDYIENMSQSAMDSVNDSMTDINNTGQTNLSYQMSVPGEWRMHPTLAERVCRAEGSFADIFSAHAATGSIFCTSGSVDFNDASNGWSTPAATDYYVIRTFNNCSGPYNLFTLTGKTMIHWSNMKTGVIGLNKLQGTSKLEQVPINKKATRNLNGMYVTVEGNSATTLTDPNDSANTGKVAHTVIWSAVPDVNTRSFTVDTNLIRKGYTADGTLFFNHEITTPTPLSIAVDLGAAVPNRTISGTLRVYHVLANVTLETTFSSLVVPISNCVPSSGSATISISGARTASGTITYTGNGGAEYSYTTGAGKTTTGSFVVTGCQ